MFSMISKNSPMTSTMDCISTLFIKSSITSSSIIISTISIIISTIDFMLISGNIPILC